MNGSIIIKLQNPANFQESKEEVKINKLDSSISPSDFIKLLKKADNKVNPRSARVNKITKSIHETLEWSPELFWYKSKGILLATENCVILERNRIRISFDNDEFEGIMDGGHNTFAIATFLIEKLFGKKLKEWSECKDFWNSNYDEIVKEFEGNPELHKFSIPIEIIYPNNEEGALNQYYDYIAEICSARNNNVQLTETSKGNKIGLYDELKKAMDNRFEVIWKGGESGVIKSEDVISMAAIPLILLQERNHLPNDITPLSPVSIYSQKSKCVDFYNTVLEHKEVSTEEKGKHILKNNYVASGLNLVEDIMVFFDKLFIQFPLLYNKSSPAFGRIKSVNDKKSKLALFRTGTCDYDYPLGFVYPLITGVTELIEIDTTVERLKWRVSPISINLDEINMGQYIDAIKLANYDPQTVGKQTLFYKLAKSIFEDYVRKNLDNK